MLASESVTDSGMFEWVTSAPYDAWHLQSASSTTTTACGKTFAVYDQRSTSDLPFPVDLCPACRGKALQRTEEYIG